VRVILKMIFELNYGATIVMLPLDQHVVKVHCAHFVAECPKDSPDASNVLFERVKKAVVEDFYSKAGTIGSLVDITGETSSEDKRLITNLRIYYLLTVFTLITHRVLNYVILIACLFVNCHISSFKKYSFTPFK